MDTFKALRTYTEGSRVSQRFEQLTLDDIDDGDVVIRTAYSGVNYKDAMAAQGILPKVPPEGGPSAGIHCWGLAGVVKCVLKRSAKISYMH